MERVKTVWRNAAPLWQSVIHFCKLFGTKALSGSKALLIFTKKFAVASWPFWRNYFFPAMRVICVAFFHIFRVSVLPATALMIAILTQTKIGGVILLGMAAWLAAKSDLGEVIKEQCGGSWWETIKCSIVVMLGS